MFITIQHSYIGGNILQCASDKKQKWTLNQRIKEREAKTETEKGNRSSIQK